MWIALVSLIFLSRDQGPLGTRHQTGQDLGLPQVQRPQLQDGLSLFRGQGVERGAF